MIIIENEFEEFMNSKKYVNVTNLSAYKALPENERTIKKRYWPGPWYLKPMGLPMDMEEMRKKDFDSGEGWRAFDKYIKSQYPIQYFIREGWQDNEVYWLFYIKQRQMKEFYHKWVYRTFKPYNTEIRKAIPTRDWKDLPQMIPDVLYAMIINLIDNDRGGEIIEIDYTQEDKYGEREILERQNNNTRKILEIYEWAKTGRPVLEKQVDDALTEASDKVGELSYEDRYGKMNRLEKLLADKNTEYLTWIVTNREVLWT